MENTRLPLGSELNEAFINFVNKYRNHPTNHESYHWQFSYIPDKSVITAIVDKNKILGTQCMMPIYILINDKTILSGKCENSYLHERLRGKEHFSELFSFASNTCKELNYKLLWAFTPALKPYSRLGFKIYHNSMINAQLYIKKPSLKQYFSNKKGLLLITRVFSFCFMLLSLFYIRLISFFNKNKTPIVIKDKSSNTNDIELLQKEVRKNYPSLIQINHEQEFIKWRVNQNPNIDFKSLFFYLNDKLVCYCFYSINKTNAHLRNFVYSNPKYVKPILMMMIQHLRKTCVCSILFQGNYENELNKTVFQYIKRMNFRKINRKGIGFVYKFADEFKNKAVKNSDWFINNLWTEGY